MQHLKQIVCYFRRSLIKWYPLLCGYCIVNHGVITAQWILPKVPWIMHQSAQSQWDIMGIGAGVHHL